jgi:hypothetical protein
MMSGEASRFHKSCGVSQEEVSFSGRFEEIECVVVEDAVFNVLMALHQ